MQCKKYGFKGRFLIFKIFFPSSLREDKEEAEKRLCGVVQRCLQV